MLRAGRLFFVLTKCHERNSSVLVSSSLQIVRRSFYAEDTNMSGKSLPKWIPPEGTGELKLYNSLTREKVRVSFCLLMFFLCSKRIFTFVCNLMQFFLPFIGSTNRIHIRFFPAPFCVLLNRKTVYSTLIPFYNLC